MAVFGDVIVAGVVAVQKEILAPNGIQMRNSSLEKVTNAK